MNLPTQQPTWVIEFDRRYDQYNPKNDTGQQIPTWNGADYNDIKSFISALLRQADAEAYDRGHARGWTQRDNDYQAIGEKPPEQEAAKRAVEFARAIKKETLSMSARDSMARTPGGETEYLQGYLMGLDDAARSIDRIVDNYLGALPPKEEKNK